MSEQPEALRLADEMEADGICMRAAAELRRLHQFAEAQIGRATAAEAALQMTKATHALKIDALERQRDALLEALKDAVQWFSKLEDWSGVGDPNIDVYTAAIKAVEGEKE